MLLLKNILLRHLYAAVMLGAGVKNHRFWSINMKIYQIGMGLALIFFNAANAHAQEREHWIAQFEKYKSHLIGTFSTGDGMLDLKSQSVKLNSDCTIKINFDYILTPRVTVPVEITGNITNAKILMDNKSSYDISFSLSSGEKFLIISEIESNPKKIKKEQSSFASIYSSSVWRREIFQSLEKFIEACKKPAEAATSIDRMAAIEEFRRNSVYSVYIDFPLPNGFKRSTGQNFKIDPDCSFVFTYGDYDTNFSIGYEDKGHLKTMSLNIINGGFVLFDANKNPSIKRSMTIFDKRSGKKEQRFVDAKSLIYINAKSMTENSESALPKIVKSCAAFS